MQKASSMDSSGLAYGACSCGNIELDGRFCDPFVRREVHEFIERKMLSESKPIVVLRRDSVTIHNSKIASVSVLNDKFVRLTCLFCSDECKIVGKLGTYYAQFESCNDRSQKHRRSFCFSQPGQMKVLPTRVEPLFRKSSRIDVDELLWGPQTGGEAEEIRPEEEEFNQQADFDLMFSHKDNPIVGSLASDVLPSEEMQEIY